VAEDEVKKYLAEAKSAIEDSESKEKLLEAVENLSNALKEARKAREMNLEGKKCDLNKVRMHCERAENLLGTMKEKAPVATELVIKGIPEIKRNIKELFHEVQNRANLACQQSKGTSVEKIACAVNQEIQKWQIGDEEEMKKALENVIFSLESTIPNTSKNKHIHDKIGDIRKERKITKQYELLAILIPLIPLANMHANPHKKSVVEWLNSPATIAAFIGFLSVEVGTYFYPVSYNHIISAIIALIAFVIVAMLNRD
jgi:hypothetical protein